MGKQYILFFVAGIAVIFTACGASKCPTEGDFGVSSSLELDILDAVSVKLNDPGSYSPLRYMGMTTKERPDTDERYFDSVAVNFTAKNAFGGTVQGQALVNLGEDPNDGCGY